MKENVDDLVHEVTWVKNNCKDGKRLYEKLASSNHDLDEFSRAVRFYVLNRIAYSGTVDSGGYSAEAFEKRFTLSNVKKLGPLSSLLQDVEITNKSYEILLSQTGKCVFIFMDPPYWKSKKIPLYGRNGGLNKSFNHEEFAENVRKCEHKWLITYDDSDLIRSLFKFEYRVYPWELQYGMNNVHSNKAAKGKELFISNYDLI